MEPLVEIRCGVPAPSGVWATLKSVFKPPTQPVPKFYGPNSTLKFDRGPARAPLVYLLKGKAFEAPDASLIETELPVSRHPPGQVADLPNWPNYRGASPQQRSIYIDWLVGGRKDPQVPIGYVFIYFYGLERRVIVDNADHSAILAETVRLLQIYYRSHSFVRYATRFLWTTIWLGLKAGTITGPDLKSAILQTNDWSDEIRGLSLACFALLNFRVSAQMAYLLTSHDPQAPQSVIVNREPALHRAAFCKRFDAAYPDGFALKVSKRVRRLEYFPASATLPRIERQRGALAGVTTLDVLGVPSQFRPLIQLWTESIEELRVYDRLHRKAGAQVTAEMFEALPDELREGDHPHFESWYKVLNRSVTEDGWTVVAVGQLAQVEGLPERRKLTKTQSLRLATTAECMGLAVEPDPRITGRAYAWDEVVSVFPFAESTVDQTDAYQATSVLLELGVAIAAADGVIDDCELRRITAHFESQFALSSRESLRLSHLRYLRTKHPTHKFDAARSLQKKLTLEQRRLVGQFLVGIAAVDNQIAPEEVRALRRAYCELGLPASELESLLRSAVAEPSAPGPDLAVQALRLDMTRVNSIIAETAKVKEFLQDALGEDVEDETADEVGTSPHHSPAVDPASHKNGHPTAVQPTTVGTVDPRFDGLSKRYLAFAARAIGESQWQRSALDAVARQNGLMLAGALDVINEWAYETLGDALLVDGDQQILVQRDLVQSEAHS